MQRPKKEDSETSLVLASMVGRLLVLWASSALIPLFSGSHSFVLDSTGGGRTMSSGIKRFYSIGKQAGKRSEPGFPRPSLWADDPFDVQIFSLFRSRNLHHRHAWPTVDRRRARSVASHHESSKIVLRGSRREAPEQTRRVLLGSGAVREPAT